MLRERERLQRDKTQQHPSGTLSYLIIIIFGCLKKAAGGEVQPRQEERGRERGGGVQEQHSPQLILERARVVGLQLL